MVFRGTMFARGKIIAGGRATPVAMTIAPHVTSVLCSAISVWHTGCWPLAASTLYGIPTFVTPASS